MVDMRQEPTIRTILLLSALQKMPGPMQLFALDCRQTIHELQHLFEVGVLSASISALKSWGYTRRRVTRLVSSIVLKQTGIPPKGLVSTSNQVQGCLRICDMAYV